jgi:peptide/nickel transport system permease protein
MAIIEASLTRSLLRSPVLTNPRLTRTPLAMAVRRFLHQPAGVLGLAILMAAVLLAAFGPLIAPYSPIQQFPGSELGPPSARFPLGTDSIGRDLLSRVIFGTRVSLLVGVIAVALGAGLGGTGGLVAGYAGGLSAAVIMRLSDAVFAVPAVLLGIAFAAALASE